MIRRLAAFVLGLLASAGAQAQTAVQQTGPVVANSPAMWASDHHVRQAAGAAGDIAGKMITGGFSAVGNVCSFSNTLDQGGVALCLDSVNGRLVYNGAGYPLNAGGGNVTGPTSTTTGSLAFFNNSNGALLSENRAPVSGYYYPPTTGQSLKQTTASQDPAALFALEKTYDTGGLPAGPAIPRPTLYSACKLNAIGTDNENKSCRGMMGEGIDNVGGFGTFVEGGKFVGLGSDAVPAGTGGAYGVIAWGQSKQSQYTVGIESQTVKTGGADAPGPSAFNPAAGFVVNFLASNGVGVGKRNDVGFLVNPFNAIKTSTGFACGAGSIEGTAGVCFGDYGGSAIGMDLSLGGRTANPYALASIVLSNNSPLSLWKLDGTTLVPGMYMGADDIIHINTGATSTTSVQGNLLAGGNLTVTPGTIATTAVIISPTTVAALPACAAGTDGWIKRVTDASGPTWNATVAGGGAVKVLVMCDSANWKVR